MGEKEVKQVEHLKDVTEAISNLEKVIVNSLEEQESERVKKQTFFSRNPIVSNLASFIITSLLVLLFAWAAMPSENKEGLKDFKTEVNLKFKDLLVRIEKVERESRHELQNHVKDDKLKWHSTNSAIEIINQNFDEVSAETGIDLTKAEQIEK